MDETITTSNNYNETKLVNEFIQNLKEDIETSNNESSSKINNQDDIINQATSTSTTTTTTTTQFTAISSLINVNNLSNQTFVYIINWLKQQQQQQLSKQNENNDFKDQKIMNGQQQHQSIPLLPPPPPPPPDMINAQDFQNMIVRFKELEDENQQLKSQLNEININKDNEIQRLKRVIEELVKSNEEKDKKLDELTKQVIRFKRIQEIVLSAQSNIGKHKNINDFEFDLDNSPEESNKYRSSKQSSINQHQLHSQQESQMVSNDPNSKIIQSNSLSSSLSSSSSTSTSSINNQQNNNGQTAPLATISELQNDKIISNNSDENLEEIHFSNDFQQKLFEKNTDKASLIPNQKKVRGKGSICSLNNVDKYSSNSSINNRLLSSLLLNNNSGQKSNKNKFFTQKNNSINISGSGMGKGIRGFFGKLMRSSLVNVNDTDRMSTSQIDDCFEAIDSNLILLNNNTNNNNNNNTTISSNFKRGGLRSTANARLQSSNFNLNSSSKPTTPVHQLNNINHLQQQLQLQLQLQKQDQVDTFTFAEWPPELVYDWLRKNGFEAYFPVNSDGICINKWIKSGLHLLQASQFEFEKELGIKNPLHRKRLTLLLQALYNSSISLNTPENYNMNLIDQYWVTKWLDDIGLPQYKDIFHECKVDGMMLHHLSNEDFQLLNINSELHYLSIKRAIHVLRLNNFDPNCLRRRPSGDDQLDKSEVSLWTNHRVMEWLRSIDLSEYAPNLRGSGVHGGLMVFETRFNSTVLADILSIPSSKTLLRRHLNSLFIDLIGPTMQKLKKDAELQPGYQTLTASAKVKHSKRNTGMGSIFSHKRTKSQDSRDFFSGPILILNQRQLANSNENSLKKVGNGNKVSTNQSATLPINTVNFSETLIGYNSTTSTSSFNNDSSSFKVKLSILSSQDNVPTSIV